MFLFEIDRGDLVESVDIRFSPTAEMMELFIKRRQSLPGLKAFRKKQNTKQQWRANKYEMLRSIRRFHSSIQGKRFHRNLGRFLSNRIFREPLINASMFQTESYNDVKDLLKSLSSLETQLYIHMDNYRPVSDEINFDIFKDSVVPITIQVRESAHKMEFDLEESKLDILLYAIPQDVLMDYVWRKGFKSPYPKGTLEKLDKELQKDSNKDKTYLEVIRGIVSSK